MKKALIVTATIITMTTAYGFEGTYDVEGPGYFAELAVVMNHEEGFYNLEWNLGTPGDVYFGAGIEAFDVLAVAMLDQDYFGVYTRLDSEFTGLQVSMELMDGEEIHPEAVEDAYPLEPSAPTLSGMYLVECEDDYGELTFVYNMTLEPRGDVLKVTRTDEPDNTYTGVGVVIGDVLVTGINIDGVKEVSIFKIGDETLYGDWLSYWYDDDEVIDAGILEATPLSDIEETPYDSYGHDTNDDTGYEGEYTLNCENIAMDYTYTEDLIIYGPMSGTYIVERTYEEDFESGDGIEFNGLLFAHRTAIGYPVSVYKKEGSELYSIQVSEDGSLIKKATRGECPLDLSPIDTELAGKYYIEGAPDDETYSFADTIILEPEGDMWEVSQVRHVQGFEDQPGTLETAGSGFQLNQMPVWYYYDDGMSYLKVYDKVEGGLEGRWIVYYWDVEENWAVVTTGWEKARKLESD